MRIYVDADACPGKDIIEDVARSLRIPVTMIVDTSHILSSDYSEVITVSQGSDSVDLALINRCEKGDLIVTQDYGLAALALGKGCFAIHPKGRIYSNQNIDIFLMERHISKEVRRAGKRHKGVAKRTKNDDEYFKSQFTYLCKQALS